MVAKFEGGIQVISPIAGSRCRRSTCTLLDALLVTTWARTHFKCRRFERQLSADGLSDNDFEQLGYACDVDAPPDELTPKPSLSGLPDVLATRWTVLRLAARPWSQGNSALLAPPAVIHCKRPTPRDREFHYLLHIYDAVIRARVPRLSRPLIDRNEAPNSVKSARLASLSNSGCVHQCRLIGVVPRRRGQASTCNESQSRSAMPNAWAWQSSASPRRSTSGSTHPICDDLESQYRLTTALNGGAQWALQRFTGTDLARPRWDEGIVVTTMRRHLIALVLRSRNGCM